jgi:hypothetical protein
MSKALTMIRTGKLGRPGRRAGAPASRGGGLERGLPAGGVDGGVVVADGLLAAPTMNCVNRICRALGGTPFFHWSASAGRTYISAEY